LDERAVDRMDRPTPRRLCKPDRLGDGRGQHRHPVALPHVGQHSPGVRGAPVEHGGQDPPDQQLTVEDALYVGDGVQELADATVAEHLALQRHQHLVRGGERIERQHTERGRAVQQHHVVLVQHALQRGAQHVLAAGPGQQLRLGTGEVDGGRQQVHALLHLDQDVGSGRQCEEHLVHALVHLVGVDPQAERQARLGVQIDEQHPVPLLGDRGSEGGHRRRLGHPALLVGHGQNARHEHLPLSRPCGAPEREMASPAYSVPFHRR